VGNQDLNNPGYIISGDREGDRPIVRMIEREQRTVNLGNLGVPYGIDDGLNRLSIEGFYSQPFKHPPSCITQHSDDLGELFEV
jgi:hypothetical protein